MDPDNFFFKQKTAYEIDQAIQNWNVNLPTGQLFGANRTFNIKAGGQLRTAEAFRPIILSYRQGKPVRLDQVANVIDSVENVFNGSWFYNKRDRVVTKSRAINVHVVRQSGT